MAKQIGFVFRSWGGKRKGAGRKPKGSKPGVSHRTRPLLDEKSCAHVTLKVRKDVWNLRERKVFRVVRDALFRSSDKGSFRIAHYSVQKDHVHLIVEGEKGKDVSRGIQSLCVRMAKRLNLLMNRRGSVFLDRFHMHVLKGPKEVFHAVRYVLSNGAKHLAQMGRKVASDWIDPLCSAAKDALLLPEPRSWILSSGWKRISPEPNDGEPATPA